MSENPSKKADFCIAYEATVPVRVVALILGGRRIELPLPESTKRRENPVVPDPTPAPPA